jgi:hypothetical protein
MRFLSFLKQVDRRLAFLIVLLLLVGVPAVLLRGYLRTPSFLFSLKDAMAQDSRIRKVIGPSRGYSLSYSKQDLSAGDTAQFSVQLIGSCDSTYALVKGLYYQKGSGLTYQIRDTTFVKHCQ